LPACLLPSELRLTAAISARVFHETFDHLGPMSVEVLPNFPPTPSSILSLERNNGQVVRCVGEHGSGRPASRKPGPQRVSRVALGRSPQRSAGIKKALE